VFDDKENFTLAGLKNKKLDKIAAKEALADNSSSGTAVTVYSQNGNVALLTCAHTITFPDTIIAYKYDASGVETNFIESISIKEKQVIYVAGFPEGSQVEILANDHQLDIALIGRKYGAQQGIFFPSFNYPLGKAKEVEWGTLFILLDIRLILRLLPKQL